MFQLIYELRKNCCGTGGRDVEIEGSTRGPRGPKKLSFTLFVSEGIIIFGAQCVRNK